MATVINICNDKRCGLLEQQHHREREKLDKVIRKSSSVLGCPLDSVREVGDRRVLSKLTSMLDHE